VEDHINKKYGYDVKKHHNLESDSGGRDDLPSLWMNAHGYMNEDFDTPTELLLDPKNNDRTFNDVLKDFEKSGGKVLGQGSNGTVLYHPKWKSVLKIFYHDVPYLTFIRFAMKHPRKSFPVLLDKPRSITPNLKRKRDQDGMYVVRTERLEPITKEEFLDIDFYLYYGKTDFANVPDNYVWEKTKEKIKDIEKKYPTIKTLLDDYDFLMSSGPQWTKDINQNNIMKRKNGEFVLADPLWEGETPYQTHDRLAKAEMGYTDDDYNEPPMIRGGEKRKKEKPPKPVKYVRSKEDDEIPF